MDPFGLVTAMADVYDTAAWIERAMERNPALMGHGLSMTMVPTLRVGVRLEVDPVRRAAVLLYPEGVLVLNDTASAVARRCNGALDVGGILADLSDTFDGVDTESVCELLAELADRRLVALDEAVGSESRRREEPALGGVGGGVAPREPLPVGLLAELTYRCPLRCTYCSNPLILGARSEELTTSEWLRVVEQARRLGVLQLHLSGGEPLLRRDLALIVRCASELGMYTNLVTSGHPLTDSTLDRLVDAGLDHLQLSIQDATAGPADEVAGIRVHARKIETAARVRQCGLPLTVNVVLHAGNVDRIDDIAQFAADLGASRIELAHTQYYGWALRNRSALMPTPQQVARASASAVDIRARFGSSVEIVYVQPDYHDSRPKPCMNGWGSRQLVTTPTGDVLPCLAAGVIPDLGVQNIRDHPLRDIWYDSPAFEAFRGTAWMKSPCRECPMREVDFGGCRCQAYAITGDAAAADPVCELSPHHGLVSALSSATTTSERPLPVPRRYR